MVLLKSFWIKIVKNVCRGMTLLACLSLLLGANPNVALARFSVDSAFTVSSTYTDNLFFTFANKESDFGTFLSPIIRLEYEDRNVVVQGTYRGTGQLFVNNTEANSYVQNADFTFDLPILNRKNKNLQTRVDWSFNLTPELPAFSLFGEPNPISNINPGSTTTTAGAVGGTTGGVSSVGGGAGALLGGAGVGGSGFSGPVGLDNNGSFTTRSTTAFQNLAGIKIAYLLSPRVDLDLNYTNKVLRFTGSGFQDSIRHTAGGGVAFLVNPNTKIAPNYRLQIINFKGSSNVTTHRASVDISHKFSETLTTRFSNGTNITEGALDYFTRVLFTKAHENGLILVRFTQDIGSGSGIAATATLSQNAIGQITSSFTKNILGFLLFGYGNNSSLSGNAIDIETFQARAGLNLAINSWLNGFATVSYVNQNSQGTSTLGTTAQKNQVFLGVTAIASDWSPFK